MCSRPAFLMTSFRILIIKDLIGILTRLSEQFFTVDSRNIVYKRISVRIERKQEKLNQMLDYAQSIYWMERKGVASCQLCVLPKQLDFLLHEDLWRKEEPYLLTSATLSVDGDFSHFMQQTGIDFLQQERLAMLSKSSPFDYESHGLLYLPDDMPRPDVRDRTYINAVIDRLEELIRYTYGHTLALFTSYRLMEIVYQELSVRITSYPLFCMGKGCLEAITAFRESGNGILLASDSAGEGIDLAGDILSSLVVVKLPFPIPDPVLEYEKSLYEDFFGYLSESIVPSMLMKLRQWIGRGIRKETDTCVFSILDCRAGERYKNDILTALPDMPVTDNIEDVGIFIRSNKPESYFGDNE